MAWIPKQKRCKWCGQKFSPDVPTRRYCSEECYNENRKDRARFEEIKCDECGKTFKKRNYLIKKHNYCSPKCHPKMKTGKIVRKCKNCGKEYSVYASQVLHRGSSYCGINCSRAKNKSKKPKQHQIDELWSKIIKLRAGNKCEFDNCDKDSRLNSHHIFSRTNSSVRWYLDNGICLCSGHHLLGIFSAHKAPLEFAEWIQEKRGCEWYTDLRKLAKTVYKPEHERIFEGLKKELKKYEETNRLMV